MPATSTKPRTRNRSVKSAGRTPIGASQSVKALMIAINWPDAPSAQVVTITATKDFDLDGLTVNTLNGETIAQAPIKVLAGTVLHFVRSSYDGLYYVGRVSASGQAACTCPHCQFKKSCKHQELILDAHNARAERLRKREAKEFSQAVAALPDQAENASECLEPDLLSFEECLYNAESLAERKAIWKQVVKEERARQKAIGAEYWGKVDALHAQDIRKIG